MNFNEIKNKLETKLKIAEFNNDVLMKQIEEKGTQLQKRVNEYIETSMIKNNAMWIEEEAKELHNLHKELSKNIELIQELKSYLA